ncbi:MULTISPECIES: SHOCT domain-containing protein [unclassified Amycolatopsis]|uniref:SHOCT domain-containing protein n=1 Tax=unclassified Amycolatopsis TaxID=2618356 RepID=UPI0021077204|nr:SHOCT domain-containing protein [Amycolatopsis sp. DSM 110486]
MSNRVSRRQGQRWSRQEDEQYAQQQQDVPPSQPAAAPARDTVTQLKELAELKAQGVLTDAEFQSEKAKILAS